MLSRMKKWLKEIFETNTKANLESFLSLETADPSSGLFIARDGSLATVVRVDGMRRMMGSQEMAEITAAGTAALHSFMVGPGHVLQVWFMRDPEMSKHMLKSMLRPAMDTASNLSLSMDDLFDEKQRVLPGFLVHEAFYIVLWTRTSIFSRQELKKLHLDMAPPPLWPRSVDTGDVFKAVAQLRVKHLSFVSTFISEMGQAGLRMVSMDAHDAMAAMRASVYPELTICEWKPWLPGDIGTDLNGKPHMPAARMGTRRQEPTDMSHLLWPRLRDHMFPMGAEILSSSVVKVGSTLMATVDVMVGPLQIQPFQRFLDSMISSEEFPWRVSFLIESDGMGRIGFKSFLAAMSSLTGGSNGLIRDQFKALSARSNGGEAMVKIRTSFATWADSGNMRLIEERVGRLLKIVETWGLQTTSQNTGDPMDGVMSSNLGMGTRSTAPVGVEPLQDVVARLPWMRDASPFQEGSVLFRTFDGRAWPYQPGSTAHQDTCNDFIYAPPGKGKSVWLNTTNLAFCLNPGSTSGTGGAMLPRVAIIDIGLSSSGVISLLQEGLPPELRHQALYHLLRMDKEDSINPFDTQLGYRQPLTLETSFLVNFLTLIGTEAGKLLPPDGLIDLVNMVIEEVYAKFSDMNRSGMPKAYVPMMDSDIDQELHDAGIILPEDPSWWWVTDALFKRYPNERGAHLASMAQRYAMPLLADLPQVAQSPKIRDIFGKTQVTGSNELLIEMFIRSISSAIRSYPILVHPTRLDLSGARVVSLDLQQAAPGAGSPADNKQTSMVYMLARFVLARDFYLYPDDVRGAPDLYKDYQFRRIERIRESPKRLVLDEFHRTKSASSVRQQVIVDMREGRKHGVQIALASQMLEDFDDEMLGLGSGFWIMGCANEQDREAATRKFGLSDTGRMALSSLNGPLDRGRGAPFLAVLNMKDGQHEHLLLNTLGPIEMWAFSTTPDDVNLRKRLYELIGPVEARKRLAIRFPNGTAVKEITRRKTIMNSQGRLDMNAQKGIWATLAQEMAEQPL